MTTTTPESRGRIAYTAFGRKTGFKKANGDELPSFDDLDQSERDGWINAAQVIWDLAKTGRATL